MMNRRRFLAAAPLLAAAAHSSLRAAVARSGGRPPRILLRSSWQSVNIGDIGHTPGALGLLERYFPEAEITLWPGELGHGAREMLVRAFPRLRIVEGSLDAEGHPRNAELAEAWRGADLYLSGSGSGFPAAAHAVAFRRTTGKPVGVFGVSNDPISGFGAGRDPEGGTLRSLRERALALPTSHLAKDLRYVIDASAFFFCRDTITRDYLKAQGIKTPILEFGPDAQLGMTLRDEARGTAWMTAHGLEPGRFICVIPRLRYTPYHRIRPNAKSSPDDAAKDAINARTVDADHAKLRELIVAYVRATGNRVVACAEMTYQVALAREQLVEPLPADVKSRVVWRDTYWLPDEAASIYARAQAVISMECHSPLIALHNGTPAFYLRQPTDTCKGQMYRDFGAGEWMFEIDESDGAAWWKALAAICADADGARARVATIMRDVEARQRRMVEAARAAIAAGS